MPLQQFSSLMENRGHFQNGSVIRAFKLNWGQYLSATETKQKAEEKNLESVN